MLCSAGAHLILVAQGVGTNDPARSASVCYQGYQRTCVQLQAVCDAPLRLGHGCALCSAFAYVYAGCLQ